MAGHEAPPRDPPEAIAPFPYGESVYSAVAGRACVFFDRRRTKTRAAGARPNAIDHYDSARSASSALTTPAAVKPAAT